MESRVEAKKDGDSGQDRERYYDRQDLATGGLL